MVIRNNTQTLSYTHTQIEKKERKEWKGREEWKKRKKFQYNLNENTLLNKEFR